MAAIPPLGPPSLSGTAPSGKGAARGDSRLTGDKSSTASAVAAESETARRIEQSQAQLRDAARDADVQLTHAKEQSDQALASETDRSAQAIEDQRTRGYSELRDLKRRQEAELNRVKREGERDLQNTHNFYEDENQKALHEGERQLRDSLSRQALMNQTEDGSAKLQHTEAREMQRNRLEALKATQDSQFAELSEAQAKHLEQARATSLQSRENTDALFEKEYQNTVSTHQATLDRLNRDASRELNQLKTDTAQKLSAYSSRQNDPFYKLVDLGAALEEDDHGFVLRASIPEHERERLNVNVQGDRLILSGYRRNEEKLDLGPGRAQTTASYQAYTESFPLPWPVDARGMSKEFDGDQLVVRLPKKNEFSKAPTYQKAAPERAKAERPRFPGNLPGAAAAPKNSKPLA